VSGHERPVGRNGKAARVSFDDHAKFRPTVQQTARCGPEQIQGARKACERYVRRKGDSDLGLLRELIEMLGLERTVDEITAEAAALADQEEAS
jgi:hypothetical protein